MLKSPLYIKLKSINDFARLVCSLERIPLPIYGFSYKNEEILAVNLDNASEETVFYYINYICNDKDQYLSYKISGSSEEVSFVESIKDTSASYSPVIKIIDLPQFLTRSSTNSFRQFINIELKDIYSLSKIAAFRINFDDSPMPLFFFPKDNLKTNRGDGKRKFVLGTSINLSDSMTRNYFYYILFDHYIEKNFLKFSTQKTNKPTYSNVADEHGFIYLKIIRMDKCHPLVKFK